MESVKIFTFFLLSVPFVFAGVEFGVNKISVFSFYYEQIIFQQLKIVNTTSLTKCSFFRIYNIKKFNEQLENYKRQGGNIEPISFEKFNEKKKECDKLDYYVHPINETPKETTKWCGYEGLAESYDDLGSDRVTDRCCRDHALCPVGIEGRDTRYNLTNEALAPSFLCSCEREFYSCLPNTDTANKIKDAYFSRAINCIKGIPNKDKLSFEKTIQQNI